MGVVAPASNGMLAATHAPAEVNAPVVVSARVVPGASAGRIARAPVAADRIARAPVALDRTARGVATGRAARTVPVVSVGVASVRVRAC